MSPVDLGRGLNVIQVRDWDWVSSHNLRFLYPTVRDQPDRRTCRTSPADRPARAGQGIDSFQSREVSSHAFQRVVGRRRRDDRISLSTAHIGHHLAHWPLQVVRTFRSSQSSSEKTAAKARQDRWKRWCCGKDLPVHFASGVEFLLDSTEPHLVSMRFVDISLELIGVDHPAFSRDRIRHRSRRPPPPGAAAIQWHRAGD
jgi:hypothetical protein